MRWLAPVLLFAIMAGAPLAMAQEPVTTRVAEDPGNDVKADVQGNPVSMPADTFLPADLRGLDVVETPDDFLFVLSVGDLDPDADGPFVGATLYTVEFAQNDRPYRIRATRMVFLTEGYGARLEGFDPGRGSYFTIGPLAAEADEATGTLTVTVPRLQLLDSNGAAPHPEVPITGFRASAQGAYTTSRNSKLTSGVGTILAVKDAMPDSGNATTDVRVQFGVRQSGNARLSSLIPTRASNGEATTFVFLVNATNLATEAGTFTLATTTVPRSWTVKLPSTQITIPGNGTVSLPVLVTTPFTHTHGSFENFVLTMTSLDDAQSVGRVQLGVRYLQPPQPAGHHAQLWFHSDAVQEDPATDALFQAFGFGSWAYMNAADQDPADRSVEVPADNVGGDGATHTYQWQVPLSPGLEMGLDFDTANQGLLQVNVGATAPLPGAVLSGYLAHYGAPQSGTGPRPGQGPLTILADVVATEPKELGNGRHTLETTIAVRPAADFIPFQRGASLVLVLNLTAGRPDQPILGTTAPTLVPGSHVTLPLFEYHDPVNDIFVSDVEIVARSTQDRFANPGKAALFNLTLHNRGATDASFLIELTGTNLDWARLLPPQTSVHVPANGSYDFHVAVQVPADTRVPTGSGAERPAADIVIAATNQADINQRALVRLHTAVDSGTHRDDAGLVQSLEAQFATEPETPGFGVTLSLVALATLAVLRRRR